MGNLHENNRPGKMEARAALSGALIQAVREASPIEEVVGEQFNLRRAGSQFTGLCPFHSEETPSFYVHPGKGTFYCHGCQVGGDVYGFIQKFYNLNFPQAVAYLARRVGIEIEGFEPTPEQQAQAANRKMQRDEDTLFKHFCIGRVREITDACLSLARAATRAENALRTGTLHDDEQLLAWDALERYRAFEARLEHEQPLDPEILRSEWEAHSVAA